MSKKYIILLSMAVAIVILIFLPHLIYEKRVDMVFEFPTLSGRFAVGTRILYFIDHGRKDTTESTKQNPRELLVQVYYPASGHNKATLAPYAPEMTSAWQSGLKASGWPEEQVAQIQDIRIHAVPNASLSNQKPFPLIIFSHGYVALRTAYTAYCEQLASHGYIVAAIGYTHYAKSTMFPDGRIIGADPQNESQEKLLNERKSNNEQEIWLADTKFVIDELEKLNKEPHNFLSHAFDAKRIGIMGHSFGGSTAAQMCRRDIRVKAGIDLDGGLFGEDATENFNKPFLVILGGKVQEEYKKMTDQEISQKVGWPVELVSVLREKYFYNIPQLIQNLGENGHVSIINGADHAAFSDWVLLKHMPLYSDNVPIFNLEHLTGSVDGFEVSKKISQESVNFFDKYLNKK